MIEPLAVPTDPTESAAVTSDERSAAAVLFVSGAGLQPWIWDDTRSALERACPGAVTRVAERPDRPTRGRLRDHALAAIDSAPPGPFTIVAHSSGGVIAAEIAQKLGERVEAMLGVCAVIPRPGGSFLTAHPAPRRWVLGAATRVCGTRPPAAVLRRGLTAGLDHDVAERVVAEFDAESPGLYRDRVGGGTWNGATGYVFTARDRMISRGRQSIFASRLAPRWEHTLDTGYLPMLEDPDGLARAVTSFLDDHAAPDGSAVVGH